MGLLISNTLSKWHLTLSFTYNIHYVTENSIKPENLDQDYLLARMYIQYQGTSRFCFSIITMKHIYL